MECSIYPTGIHSTPYALALITESAEMVFNMTELQVRELVENSEATLKAVTISDEDARACMLTALTNERPLPWFKVKPDQQSSLPGINKMYKDRVVLEVAVIGVKEQFMDYTTDVTALKFGMATMMVEPIADWCAEDFAAMPWLADEALQLAMFGNYLYPLPDLLEDKNEAPE